MEEQNTEPKVFIVPLDLMQRIMNFLGTCPYDSVYGIINEVAALNKKYAEAAQNEQNK